MTKSVSGSVLLLLMASCAVRVGSDAQQPSSSGGSAPAAAAAAPAAAAPAAAAPAAPGAPQKTMGSIGRRVGAAPTPAAAPAAPAAAPAPAPAAARPAGGSAPLLTPGGTTANAVAPGALGGLSALNLAKVQEIKQRNPKGCGLTEVTPGTWVRIDCQPYKASTRAVAHLSPRKAKAVSAGKTFWKPIRIQGTAKGGGATKVLGPGSLKKKDAPYDSYTNEFADDPGGGGGGGKPDALPTLVDHRTDNKEGPIRNQGIVGSCTAFSLAGAIDNQAIRAGRMTNGDRNNSSSANHIWSNYGYPQMGVAADNSLGKAIATFATWEGESDRDACKLSSVEAQEECGFEMSPTVIPGTWQTDPVLKGKVDKSNGTGAYKIAQLERLQTQPPNLQEIATTLASGSDLWIAMKIDGAAWSNNAGIRNNNMTIKDWTPGGGHAIVMSGYRDTPTGRQYLIHNSWGTSWGDNGYAWVSENMVKQWMHYAYKVKLTDTVRKEDLTDDDCAPDELLDLTTLICAVICADESRPNNGCKK